MRINKINNVYAFNRNNFGIKINKKADSIKQDGNGVNLLTKLSLSKKKYASEIDAVQQKARQKKEISEHIVESAQEVQKSSESIQDAAKDMFDHSKKLVKQGFNNQYGEFENEDGLKITFVTEEDGMMPVEMYESIDGRTVRMTKFENLKPVCIADYSSEDGSVDMYIFNNKGELSEAILKLQKGTEGDKKYEEKFSWDDGCLKNYIRHCHTSASGEVEYYEGISWSYGNLTTYEFKHTSNSREECAEKKYMWSDGDLMSYIEGYESDYKDFSRSNDEKFIWSNGNFVQYYKDYRDYPGYGIEKYGRNFDFKNNKFMGSCL